MSGVHAVAALALAASLAACAGSPGRPAAAPATAPAAASAPVGGVPAEAGMDAEVARLVNEHRARVGCRPLSWDATAVRVARAHSEDMVRRRYFDDVSPDGRTVGDRLHRAGVGWVAVAENIADGGQTAAEVVQLWLGSAEHRANIERCVYTRHGVAHHGGMWTHVFFTPQ